MLRLLKNLIEGEIVDQNKLNFCNHNIRCQIWSWLYPELSSAKVWRNHSRKTWLWNAVPQVHVGNVSLVCWRASSQCCSKHDI